MDINGLDIRLLLAFEAIWEEGRLTQAGERLGQSEPAVSKTLRQLRDRFDDPLFVRSGGRMKPTPRAEQLATLLRPALTLLRQATQSTQDFQPAKATRRFTLTMTDLGEIAFLPTLMKHMQNVAPGVCVRTVQAPARALSEAMADGAIDLAMGFFADFKSGFYQQTLFKEEFVCVVRAEHPTIGATLSRRQFEQATHALVDPAGSAHALIEQTFVKLGCHRHIALHVPHFLGVPAIIAQTDLLVTVPHTVGQAFASIYNFKILPVPFPLPQFDVKQYWHERYHADPANVWFRQQVANLFLAKKPRW